MGHLKPQASASLTRRMLVKCGEHAEYNMQGSKRTVGHRRQLVFKKEHFFLDLNKHSAELDRGSVLCITLWFIYTWEFI